MAMTRSVITALDDGGIDLLGTSNVALKMTDDQNIVSGSLLTVDGAASRGGADAGANSLCRAKPTGSLSSPENRLLAAVLPFSAWTG